MRPYAPILLAAALAGCAETSKLPEGADIGPNPQLVQPVKSMIPTVKVADAVGWAPGTTPLAAQGLKVNALADRLDHPRWIHVLPNGDVLVAESNAPPKPEGQENKGIKAWFMKMFMSRCRLAKSGSLCWNALTGSSISWRTRSASKRSPS